MTSFITSQLLQVVAIVAKRGWVDASPEQRQEWWNVVTFLIDTNDVAMVRILLLSARS